MAYEKKPQHPTVVYLMNRNGEPVPHDVIGLSEGAPSKDNRTVFVLLRSSADGRIHRMTMDQVRSRRVYSPCTFIKSKKAPMPIPDNPTPIEQVQPRVAPKTENVFSSLEKLFRNIAYKSAAEPFRHADHERMQTLINNAVKRNMELRLAHAEERKALMQESAVLSLRVTRHEKLLRELKRLLLTSDNLPTNG